MTLIGETIEVYELVEQWNFVITSSSVSGTRVYLETDSVLSTTKVNLPNLGDAWDLDYENVTLKSISVTYVNDNDLCGRKYTCQYDGTPWTQTSVVMDETTFPRNVDVSGEMLAWEPTNSSYKWATDNLAVKQPVFRNVATATFKITRVVKDFDDYMYSVAQLVNKVNGAEFYGFPAGTVLFIGANMVEFRNRIGSRRWRAELIFIFRTVTGFFEDYVDGWQYQMRNDTGEFDLPYTEVTGVVTYLYQYADFTDLFEGHALGDEEDLFNAFPDK